MNSENKCKKTKTKVNIKKIERSKIFTFLLLHLKKK